MTDEAAVAEPTAYILLGHMMVGEDEEEAPGIPVKDRMGVLTYATLKEAEDAVARFNAVPPENCYYTIATKADKQPVYFDPEVEREKRLEALLEEALAAPADPGWFEGWRSRVKRTLGLTETKE